MTSLLTEALRNNIPCSDMTENINVIKKNDIENKISSKINDINKDSSFITNENSFDPSKSSPPNDFKIRLHARYMNHFNSKDILSQK